MSRSETKSGRADTAAVTAAISAPRIVIEAISPCVEDGRYSAKAVIGQAITFGAIIFMDGHDHLAAQLNVFIPGDNTPNRVPMIDAGNNHWTATYIPEVSGSYRFSIQAWFDEWATHTDALRKKRDAGVAVELEIEECCALLRDAALRAGRKTLGRQVTGLAKKIVALDAANACALLLDPTTALIMAELDARRFESRSVELSVDVERLAAGFSSWYELFPRSQGRDSATHGTFDDVIARLPAIQAMGFDVLYFPPIHPIGLSHRKGPNNSLVAGPNDPGSPYAIGGAEGGHEAVHPALGGIGAFRRLVSAAKAYGLEIALDFAIQCSPDHPWLNQHPGWFSHRP